MTMKLYIYKKSDYTVHAVITGNDKEACERKARDLGYSANEELGSTFAADFGTTDGLRENPGAKQIQA
jgi:hypothetical protein